MHIFPVLGVQPFLHCWPSHGAFAYSTMFLLIDYFIYNVMGNIFIQKTQRMRTQKSTPMAQLHVIQDSMKTREATPMAQLHVVQDSKNLLLVRIVIGR